MGNSYADYRDEVGLKIKYYRLKKGYTQDQLAKRIGIEGNHLSKIEREIGRASCRERVFLRV